MAVQVNEALCTGCGVCTDDCPVSVLEVNGATVEVTDPDQCISCGVCVDACPSSALEL